MACALPVLSPPLPAWRKASGFARSTIGAVDSARDGTVEGLSLGNDLLLVDYTRRLFREEKTAISAELVGILARLDMIAEVWQARLEKLRVGGWRDDSCRAVASTNFRGSERRQLKSPRGRACVIRPIWADALHGRSSEFIPCRFPCLGELFQSHDRGGLSSERSTCRSVNNTPCVPWRTVSVRP